MNMSNRAKQLPWNAIVLIWMVFVAAPWVSAHFGGFILQAQDGRLIIGQDAESPGGQPNWDTQAVGSLFSPDQFSDLPSFLSLASPPSGTQALPINTNLYWDFLPMNVGGYTSNLLYWNGQGAVNFGPVPIPSGATDVTMGIYNTTDVGNPFAIVSDTPNMLEGALLGKTNNSGTGLRLHRHNFIALDDGDTAATLFVEEGVYLLALQVEMPGYGITRPIFIVPGTYGLISQSGGVATLNTAVAWVEENAGLLIRDGDYNFDGAVGEADHATWTQQYGMQQGSSASPWPLNGDFANGNRDANVDAADYVAWRKFLEGGPGGAPPVLAVPEPAALAFCVLAAAGMMIGRRKRVVVSPTR
jgi:hypothetical protein